MFYTTSYGNYFGVPIIQDDSVGTYSIEILGNAVLGCTDLTACNYDPAATIEDGNREYCQGCGEPSEGVDYTLTVESSAALHVAGNTVYRFYVNLLDPTDKFSAVFGNDQDPLVINSPDGIFNTAFNASWSASGINPAFLGIAPDMAEDSYATVGLEGPAVSPQADPSLVEDTDLVPTISQYFVTGGTSLNVSTLTGGSWYVLNTSANALPDADLRVLVMQITTAGSVSGTLNYQVFPLGVGADQVQVSVDFDGAGTFGGAPVEDCAGVLDGDSTIDECGVCDNDSTNDCVQDCNGDWGGTAVFDDCGVCGGDNSSCTGCMDELATNFNSDATISDNDSCCYLVITSASITYNDWGIGLGTVVTEGGEGEVTIVWTDADDVVATNTDSLAYNKTKIGEDINTWEALFDSQFKGYSSIQNSLGPTFTITAIYLKQSNKQDIKNPSNMTKDEIRRHLTDLFSQFNSRATHSDTEVQQHAQDMLMKIGEARKRYL